jgi:hypothetical protein
MATSEFLDKVAYKLAGAMHGEANTPITDDLARRFIDFLDEFNMRAAPTHGRAKFTSGNTVEIVFPKKFSAEITAIIESARMKYELTLS